MIPVCVDTRKRYVARSSSTTTACRVVEAWRNLRHASRVPVAESRVGAIETADRRGDADDVPGHQERLNVRHLRLRHILQLACADLRLDGADLPDQSAFALSAGRPRMCAHEADRLLKRVAPEARE